MADFNLAIMKSGEVIGAVRGDGFYTKDTDLRELLKDIFDGAGADQWESIITEDRIEDAIVKVKPREDGFYEAFRDTLSRAGYVLARMS